jgi:glyoxalase family protein
MTKLISGIHHVTALATAAQPNLDFYSGILGLRFVKKTVNFDAPEIYHLYYGNKAGDPGTILTFFPYEGIQPGRHGNGMLNTTTFSVPFSSLEFWETRLKRFRVEYKNPQERFADEVVLYFKDPDGLGLELVFNDRDTRAGYTYGHIPLEHSVKGFYGVEIWAEGYERTAGLLTGQMDHTLVAEDGDRFRFAAQDAPGSYIDILCLPNGQHGLGGGGTVHHIAFSTPNSQTQVEARKKIAERMLNPTPVIDRQYFKSVYFREPGGVLFEVATEDPGFAVDEKVENLGEEFKLPPQYEAYRSQIENVLQPVSVNIEKYR